MLLEDVDQSEAKTITCGGSRDSPRRPSVLTIDFHIPPPPSLPSATFVFTTSTSTFTCIRNTLFGINVRYSVYLTTNTANMDEDAIIRAKIAALSSKVDHHKRRVEPYPNPATHSPNSTHRGAGRWATRGRGGRVGYHHPRPSGNLVWVAGGTQTPPLSEPDAASPDADVPGTPPAGMNPRNGFILPPPSAGKRELMNKETYEREQKQKQEYQQARAAGAQPKTSPPTPKAAVPIKNEHTARKITVDGITFKVSPDGSKLVRVAGEWIVHDHMQATLNTVDLNTVFQETPRKTTIAGIDFHRTKRGNLMRAPAQDNNTTRYMCRGPPTLRTAWLNLPHRFNTSVPKAQCETFTRQGNLSSSRGTIPSWPTIWPASSLRAVPRILTLILHRFLPLRAQMPLRPRPGESLHLQSMAQERHMQRRRLL